MPFGNEIPTIQFTPLEIICNKIHPSIKLHLKEKPTQLMTIHLVQEIKRDIIYRRMNTNVNQQGRNPTRIRTHLLSTIKITISLLAYQGTRNFQDSVNFLTLLKLPSPTESKEEKEYKPKNNIDGLK
jgi:hypothetical protein